MNIVEALLGTADKSIEDPISAIILYNKGSAIPSYTPIIVSGKQLTEESSDEAATAWYFGDKNAENDKAIKGLLYFPTSRGHNNRTFSLFPRQAVLPITQKEFFRNGQIKEIDEFNFNKLGRIQEFVQNNGAIAFAIKDQMQAVKFLRNLKYFKKEYPYTASYGNVHGNSNQSDNPGDALLLSIMVYDINYAIPVYNKKKARGMAVSIAMVWPRLSETFGYLSFNHEIHFAVNTYPENLLVIDGAIIQDKSFISDAYIDHFTKILEENTQKSKASTKL